MNRSVTREFKVPSLLPGSPSCQECVERLTDSVADLHGVETAVLDVGAQSLAVTFDPELISEELLEDAASRAGVRIASEIEHTTYRVSGLDCPDCAATVDKSVGHLDGVVTAQLSFASGLMFVEWDPAVDPRQEIERSVRSMGYGIQDAGEPEIRGGLFARRGLEIVTAVAGLLIAAGWLAARSFVGLPPYVSTLLYAAAIVVGGSTTARRAVSSIRARSLDMNVLMAVAVLGAAAIGEWAEGAMVLFLYSVGMLLEARSLARTRTSIRELVDLAPSVVTVERDGADAPVVPEDVLVGETIVVRAGERIALDGTVASGTSAVDESAVTGESVPADKGPGDPVYAGSLNTSGLLRIEVTSAAADSTLARIIYLVEEAQARQAPAQRLVDRFTRYYTPAVVGLASAVAIVPPIVATVIGADWGSPLDWVYRGLVLLVVSCPCALVISTPVAVVSAITRASRLGVLVKGGVFLERAATVRAIALDKTGTLTTGRPDVTVVESLDSMDTERILEVAAALEAGSTHPVARAIVDAAGEGRDAARLDAFHDLPGLGVRGTVDGIPYVFGSPQIVHDAGAPYHAYAGTVERMEDEGLSPLVLAGGAQTKALGVIGIADTIRPESARAIEDLQDRGVRHVVMLTGDSERTAEAVAGLAGVTELRARLMPEEKAGYVTELRERHGPVAMVGDGVNDAPALAAADIGIAMGAAGSDTALETADVALMRDDLALLPVFFRLGRRTVGNIVQNVVLSVVVKFAVLLLAVFGVATLWMAVFADTGVALLVILNGLRLLRA